MSRPVNPWGNKKAPGGAGALRHGKRGAIVRRATDQTRGQVILTFLLGQAPLSGYRRPPQSVVEMTLGLWSDPVPEGPAHKREPQAETGKRMARRQGGKPAEK